MSCSCTKIFPLLTIIIAGFMVDILMCAPLYAETTSKYPPIHTATHLGFATQHENSLGLNKHAGSTLFLDATTPIHGHLALGLRTAGMGSAGKTESFYRMTTGPLIQFRITENWALELALMRFSESGTLVMGRDYTSRGNALMLGWERLSKMNEQLFFIWGGFWQKHLGTVAFHTPTGTHLNDIVNQPTINSGDTRGIKIALRVLL